MISSNSVTLFVPITHLCGIWKGSFKKLPANKIYTLIIDYPLTNKAEYKIKTGKNGMDLLPLLSKIGKLYQKTYDVEDSDDRYGIWGHDIEDLSLESIHVDHKRKIITLGIGS